MYYLYCALYSAPLLRSGFDFDGYSLFMLCLCIVHVQAERIVHTEPQLLPDLPALPAVVPRMIGMLQTTSEAKMMEKGGEGKFLNGDSGRCNLQDRNDAERNIAVEEDDHASLELKQFDRMLMERERRRAKDRSAEP